MSAAIICDWCKKVTKKISHRISIKEGKKIVSKGELCDKCGDRIIAFLSGEVEAKMEDLEIVPAVKAKIQTPAGKNSLVIKNRKTGKEEVVGVTYPRDNVYKAMDAGRAEAETLGQKISRSQNPRAHMHPDDCPHTSWSISDGRGEVCKACGTPRAQTEKK